MKIHFCDLCNESVPQVDLDDGRARAANGRTICAACERAMSHSNASANAPSGSNAPRMDAPVETGGLASTSKTTVSAPRGSAATWIACLALGSTIGAIFVLDDRLRAAAVRADGIDAQIAATSGSVSDVASRSAAATRDLGSRLDEMLNTLSQRSVRTSNELEELRALHARASVDVSRMRDEIQAQQASSKSGIAEFEKRLADLSARLAKSEDERAALAKRLVDVETREPAAVVPVAEVPAPKVEAVAAWKAHVADLSSPNEQTRLSGIYELCKSLDPEVVQHLVPLLRDVNVFVRMATARVLGEMRAKPATGPLIDALEDEQSAVRESAYLALRSITSKDLKFDPLSNDLERGKRVKAWREWFAKEGGGESKAEAPVGS